ncbi:MAG: carboxylating nicotinate-nucleotide diphosphorylase [Planctomycetota bacterium]
MTEPAFKEYQNVKADETFQRSVHALVKLAIDEDLHDGRDWTTWSLIDEAATGSCEIRARESGIAAGFDWIDWILEVFDTKLRCETLIADGSHFESGQKLAILSGSIRGLLTAERIVLNLVSRLCGIATLTGRYITAMNAKNVRLYDTRKTTPGWRRLEKYAVRCGGAWNHRTGLFDGMMIKDNHLALAAVDNAKLPIEAAVEKALRIRGQHVDGQAAPKILEVEVDTLEQFDRVLPLMPDVILLDNFCQADLCEAVRRRDAARSAGTRQVVQLEASGNVRIDTIAAIAKTGVDRISSGALTHQATSLDLGLDWRPPK